MSFKWGLKFSKALRLYQSFWKCIEIFDAPVVESSMMARRSWYWYNELFYYHKIEKERKNFKKIIEKYQWQLLRILRMFMIQTFWNGKTKVFIQKYFVREFILYSLGLSFIHLHKLVGVFNVQQDGM